MVVKNLDRVILHCDLNNFFASASLTQNPTLKGLPVAVCGDVEKRHGIILAKNYIAKSYGVQTAETIWEAKRKCSDLILLSPDFKLYEKISKAAQKIYYKYTDKVEPFGVDECWLELTNKNFDIYDGVEIANKIRKEIKRKLDVTVSVGVSFNKAFAKLGSDMKKPNAITLIDKKNYKNKVWPLPCSDLIMIGRSTSKVLKSMGIFTIGDLANCDEIAIKNKLGKNGLTIKKMAQGFDDAPIVCYTEKQKPKSIGRSETFAFDLNNKREVFAAFLDFSEEICRKLRFENLFASSVAVNFLDIDFKGREVQMSLETPTDISYILAKKGLELFEKNYDFNKPLRSVGIRAIKLISNNVELKQSSLFDDVGDNKILENIEKNIIEIRNKYGKNSIKRAICLEIDKK